MRKIHLILIVIAALWNALPAGSPFRPLFDLALQDPNDIVAAEDPDVDPIVIRLPPPR